MPDDVARLERQQESGHATNLAEQLVAPTLRNRQSNCTHGCGSAGGGCGTGGCGVGSIVDLIVSEYPYNDDRRIVEVTYKGFRREFVQVPDDSPARVRDLVLVESERGIDAGTVSMTGSLVHAKRKAKRLSNEPLSQLSRVANAQDRERVERNRASESEAMGVCRTRIVSCGLQMHVVDAEWQFDHHRITFYFTADGRVDFRELVRDLAAIFRTRIELRQISIRDEARRSGGLGICGRELCCSTHLTRYEHITLEHAKDQMLQANPAKLSGQCGRLKCCLLYELDAYVDGLKRFPPLDATIRTSLGTGRVQKIDIFRDVVYLHHRESDQWETIALDELRSLANAQDKNSSERVTTESADRGSDRPSGGDDRAGRRSQT